MLYIIPNGTCAGFQMRISGEAFCKPTLKYQDMKYKIDINNNTLLAVSLDYNSNFADGVIEIYGNLEIEEALFTGWQGESIKTKVLKIEKNIKTAYLNTPLEQMNTPMNAMDIGAEPRYHNKLTMQKGKNFYEWKAELLDDLQELDKVQKTHINTKGKTKVNIQKLKNRNALIQTVDNLSNIDIINLSKEMNSLYKKANFEKQELIAKIESFTKPAKKKGNVVDDDKITIKKKKGK
jgi:hypothetical protein